MKNISIWKPIKYICYNQLKTIMIIPKQILIERYYPYLLLLFILFTGCAPKRDLVYFSDMTSSSIITDSKKQDIKISENDILSITVNSLNPESNRLFSGNINASTDPSTQKVGYKVNKDGIIQLPLIGDYKVKDLSIEEARLGILERLSKQIKNPVVDVKVLNFKITVIGEVNKPSNFNIPDDKINLLEALGLAGDMTVYGKRENVLVIRNENGSKTMKRLNLNKQETITSPYFYLKQNDIVYVEPDRAKAFEYSQNTRVLPIIIASISAAAVLAAVLLKR
ncbi:MAG: polysaccharide export outer membrane protein [Mucilaginibacter sp.]|jgi:polysaccharide export outer membrane protein|nr:polysaccharide export outer membrane protein [Mucilaginibacter sp.]